MTKGYGLLTLGEGDPLLQKSAELFLATQQRLGFRHPHYQAGHGAGNMFVVQ